MMVARGAATATLLPNGKVLIAGGFDSSTTIYHPSTDTFSAGPPMKHARGEATATLLRNGKVLIAGGYDGNTDLMSTELYNVAAGTFAPGPSMITARSAAGAALLPNGRVLIAGGNNISVPRGVSSTEIYDPSTNSFTGGPSMSVAQGPSTAILLPNRKVLITGDGFRISDNVTIVELYDPTDNSMSERSVNGIRQFYTAALLPNGKVLIAGGLGTVVNGKLQIFSSTQIYDPSQDTFADGPSMSSDRWVATAAPLADGKVLILGANGDGTNVLNSVEIYDSLTIPLRPARL